MAEQPVVRIRENSPEHVAYEMTTFILHTVEGKMPNKITREDYLNTFAECLYTIQNPQLRVSAEKKTRPAYA